MLRPGEADRGACRSARPLRDELESGYHGGLCTHKHCRPSPGIATIWEQLTSTKWSCAQADYQRTEFEGPAGWPFETDGADDHAKVWPREKGRFALYSDGREELPAEECAAAAAAAGGR